MSHSHLSGSPRRKFPAFPIDSSLTPFKTEVPPAVSFSSFPLPVVPTCRHVPVSRQAQGILCIEAISPHETACRNDLFICFADQRDQRLRALSCVR